MLKKICVDRVAVEGEFHEKSVVWYYGGMLRDRRNWLKIVQQELVEKVGAARSCIARTLGIELTPTFYD